MGGVQPDDAIEKLSSEEEEVPGGKTQWEACVGAEEGGVCGGEAIFNFSWLLAKATAINLALMRKKKRSGTKGTDGPRRGAEEKLAIFGSIHSPPLRKPAWKEI